MCVVKLIHLIFWCGLSYRYCNTKIIKLRRNSTYCYQPKHSLHFFLVFPFQIYLYFYVLLSPSFVCLFWTHSGLFISQTYTNFLDQPHICLNLHIWEMFSCAHKNVHLWKFYFCAIILFFPTVFYVNLSDIWEASKRPCEALRFPW